MMSALSFECAGEQLVGVLTHPHPNPHGQGRDLAVVVVVGGPQYRAGSHRLFVKLSLELAASGVPTLRFDVRGMGDSSGAQRSFEDQSQDIAAAIDALQQAQPQVRRVVLWGLCDGASAALLYCHERRDPRVAGLCLLNPWVRSEVSRARTQIKHYYTDRLRQPEFWKKLATGQVAGKALSELWANLRKAGQSSAAPSHASDESVLPFQQRMALGLQRFNGPVQLLLSEHDYTAREFEDHCRTDPSWRAALLKPSVAQVHVAGADHTLSDAQPRALALRHSAQLCAGLR